MNSKKGLACSDLNEAQIAGIIESAMDGTISVDEQQRIVLFNPAAEKMFGYSAAEVLGQSLDLLIPERLRAQHQEHVDRFGKTNMIRRRMRNLGTIGGLRADGSEFPIEASLSQVDTGEGKQYTVILRDITERQQVQEKLMRMATAVEQTGDSIIITDMKGIIQYVNPGFEHTTGYNSDEVIGKHTRILKGGLAGSEYYQELWSAITSGRQWTGHFTNKKKDGTLFEEEATISPVRDVTGSITGFVAVKRDVTERMRAEDEDVVRGIARKILEQAGYNVLDARGGEEAICLNNESGAPIHLLLTDVVMPKADGKEIADRLTALRPEIRVLFMSGYTDEAIVHHGVLDSKMEFIQKPFSPLALGKKVREVLDGNGRSSESK